MNKVTFWTRALLILTLFCSCEPARILCLMPMVSHSHHIFNRALTMELAKRGHQVTVFTPDPLKQSIRNHRDIVFDGAYETVDQQYDYEAFTEYNHFKMAEVAFEWGLLTCETALQSNGALQLLKLSKNETFDLIIAEVAFQECLLPFITKFGNPPVIGITAYYSPWSKELVGNYENPSYVNTYTLPLSDHMTFMQRMHNFLLDSYLSLYRKYVYMPKQDEFSRRFFGDSVPLPSQLEKNISFVMVNRHFSTQYPQPMVPAVIEIGGLQATPAKPLPKDLKEYLDSATEGVIYMSFGTNVRSDKLKEYRRRALLEAFAELPLKVLWKWESDSLPGQPPNVKIMKWIPQNDVLGHPNVKIFISHGGMLSTMEAVYHGVPVVGVPFLVDQYANLGRNVALGVAVQLDALRLTKQSVLEAVNKILKDPSYNERMKKLSAIYRDRPQTPLETAVWWTEYALRHQGAPHLRCASLDLSWYQRWLLDILAFLLVTITTILTIIYFVVRKVISALQARREKLKMQ